MGWGPPPGGGGRYAGVRGGGTATWGRVRGSTAAGHRCHVVQGPGRQLVHPARASPPGADASAYQFGARLLRASIFSTRESFHKRVPSLSKEARGSMHLPRGDKSGGERPLLSARRSSVLTNSDFASALRLKACHAACHTPCVVKASSSRETWVRWYTVYFHKSRWKFIHPSSIGRKEGVIANKAKRCFCNIVAGLSF